MRDKIRESYSNILNFYMLDEHQEVLIDAKKRYYELTGKPDEDSTDFEMRMDLFNDWFIFHYKLDSKAIKDHHQSLFLADDVTDLKINFSVFEYLGKSLFGKEQVKDFFLNDKISLDKEGLQPNLMKEDFFIGRVLTYKGKNYLLQGISFLPKEIKSLIKKSFNSMSRSNGSPEVDDYLLSLEHKVNRWKSYKHIEAKRFFSEAKN